MSDITSTIRGGLSTGRDRTMRDFMRAQVVYSACQYLSDQGAGETLIVNALNATMGGHTFSHFSGFGPYQRELFVWIARRELIRQRSIDAAVTYPHVDIEDDYDHFVEQIPVAVRGKNDLEIAKWLIEVQNMIVAGETYANLQAYLRSLRLPATPLELRTAPSETIRLVIALTRLSGNDSWSGVDSPGAANVSLRITETNIAANKLNKAYINHIETCSWVKECEDLEDNTFFNSALSRLETNVTPSITYQQLVALYKRVVTAHDAETSLWLAWMLGHAYVAPFGITSAEAIDVGALASKIELRWNLTDPAAIKLEVYAVVDADEYLDTDHDIDSCVFSLTNMSNFTFADITFTNGTFTTFTKTDQTNGQYQFDLSGAATSAAGTVLLGTINLPEPLGWLATNESEMVAVALDESAADRTLNYNTTKLRFTCGLVDHATQL